MEFLDNMIEKRLASVSSDIISGTFADKAAFEAEIKRLVEVLFGMAMLKGIDSEEARNYIQENFESKAMELYEKSIEPSLQEIEIPDGYTLIDRQSEIEELIASGDFKAADKKIEDLLSIFEDNAIVNDLIADGMLREEDIEYFRDVACPYFQELKDEKLAPEQQEMGLGQRIKSGIAFVLTGKNPYDNQTVKVKKEKVSLKEKLLNSKFAKWAKKHKLAVTAVGLTAILGTGIFIGGKFLHNRAIQNSDEELDSQSSKVEEVKDDIAMTTFEVDEFHNFNMNDQEAHTERLQLLAQAFMERGIQVVSEEECMKFETEGKMAVTPEQLNNWFISMNLEDMTDLTFTKLLADSNTDKEELSSDFSKVCNVLGAIYTTKEESPFIYQFLSNKEYSEYVKLYEEAIIENQNGKSEALVKLIKSRVETPIAATSSGPLGRLSTSLIYQQANVYNAQVVGQDIMNLYNINNDCKIDTTASFYSDDWAEYMRKVNSKFAAAIAYTGSEMDAYIQYLLTLSDAQDDNKVYIESQVLPYLEKNNIQLGEWDILENIENNNREVKSQGTGQSSGKTVSNPSKVTATQIAKEPTTSEEKAVQAQVEAELEKENYQNFENTIKEDVVGKNADGDLVVELPGEGETIIVDTETKGAYDASKDYQGKTYKHYGEYMEEHRQKVENIEGIGEVVVTGEGKLTITNPNVYLDGKGNLVTKGEDNKIYEVPIGSEAEIDSILNRYPELSEWVTTGEGDIHYSDVDDSLSESRTDITQSQINNIQNSTGSQTQNKKPSSTTPSQDKVYEDDDVKVTVQQPVQQPSIQNPQDSVLDNVDQNVLGTLTPEEQAALEEMLNAGKKPVAGEIVEETYSDVVYGSYTVPQLMNNPALCSNVPESILKNQFPAIWNGYQNWLAEQQRAAEETVSVQSEAFETGEQADIQTDIAAQIAALEEAKLELTGEGMQVEGPQQVL